MDASDFDPNNYTPTPKDWLETTAVYSGRARVWFQGIEQPVSGTGTGTVSETGDCTIEFTANISDQTWKEKVAVVGRRGHPPIVTAFEIDDPRGRFETVGEQDASFSRGYPLPEGLSWYPPRAVFTVSNPRPTRYWVAPLLNAIIGNPVRGRLLDEHPLAFYSVASIEKEIPVPKHGYVEHFVEESVGVVPFQLDKADAFLQRLPNYFGNIATLERGTATAKVTAVAVGDTHGKGLQEFDPKHQLMYGIAPILTLATGATVGVSWLEVRDDAGELVGREHRRFATPRYREKRHFILSNDAADPALGDLLTVGLKNFFGTLPSRVLVNRLHRLFDPSLTVDDQIDQGCKALDILFGMLRGADVKFFNSLDQEDQMAVRHALDEAAASIREVEKAVKLKGQMSQARYLQKMAGKVKSEIVGHTSRSDFRAKLTTLLDSFDLLDHVVMDQAFDAGTIGLTKRWDRVIEDFRNSLAHEGHLGEVDQLGVDEVAIRNHIHDIATRIVLNCCGFTGQYRPTMMPERSLMPLDWVTLDTPPEVLGYKPRRVPRLR